MVLNYFWFSRVVAPGEDAKVSGYSFKNFGAHSDIYPTAYLTAAASVGMTKADVDNFIQRLEKVLSKFREKSDSSESSKQQDSGDQGLI